MLKELRSISQSVKYENPYWQYGFDLYEKPDGSAGEYHYVHSRGSVMIVPRFENDDFLLTRQYRYLNRRVSLEFPGGGLSPNYSPAEQAMRELEEETGFSGSLRFLGAFNPCNGVTDELCSVFVASDLRTSSGRAPDDSEEFLRCRLSRAGILASIACGELWDGMSLAAWQIFLAHET
jgi:ADP-ribose pyrophosphatase